MQSPPSGAIKTPLLRSVDTKRLCRLPPAHNMKLTVLSLIVSLLIHHANAEGCDPGYYTTDAGCAKCPKGTYQNKVDADGCKPCPEGKVAVEEGSTSCTACPKLKMPTYRRESCTCILGALNKKDGSCELCAPGTYFSSNSNGRRRRCINCYNMYVQPMAGKMECELCENGTFANTKRTKCISCPDGQVPVDKKGTCGVCPAGRYFSKLFRKCEECRPDTFKAAAGQGPCLPCPRNTRSPRGASECSSGCEEGLALFRDGTCGKCKAGERFDQYRKRCTKCYKNTFMPYESVATSCLACAGNSFSGKGATECIRCPLGEFLLRDGLCGTCAPGQFRDMNTREVCFDCRPGEFSRDGIMSYCEDCPHNSFSLRGSETCIACPPGQALFEKTGECGTCPAGTHYALYAAKCTTCREGYFTDRRNVLDFCKSCPDGTTSNEKRTACI